MSEDKFSTFLSSFPEYQAAIEELRLLKRPMLLWSTASLVYVFFGLQLKVDTASLWGFQIVGLTDTKLTIFLILTAFYYTVRWLWTRHLRLRTYKDEGFMSILWKYGMPRSETKEKTNLACEIARHKVATVFHQPDPLTVIEEDRVHRGAFNELFDSKLSARVVSCVEHNVIPYYLPLAIAVVALIALGGKLFCCV